jgi:hypothetical protein
VVQKMTAHLQLQKRGAKVTHEVILQTHTASPLAKHIAHVAVHHVTMR